MTRVYLHTFGCKANQYDTETVRQALESAGAFVVPDPADADAAVVNTCTVTHVSESKMRGLVRRLARRNGRVRTVVMGCATALDDGTIARLPNVSGVVAGADPARVLEALGLPGDGVDPVLRRFGRGSRAWVKIQDGCDEHCTFCATTLARGANRSRRPEQIVEEATALADAHEELVLTGVHIGTYGRDRPAGPTLGGLLERLVNAVPRVRFRLSSVEATELDDRLAELMIGAPERLAPHLHAPLQSGSDRVLKRMGRHWYTAASYRERIGWLAARRPVLGLGADVMVGFPGETDDDHAATRSLVENLPFTYLHVFPYSQRPGAAARRLGTPVAPEVAAARSAELRAVAAEKGAAYRARRDGRDADVVLLRRHRGWYEGLTEDYLTVYLPTERAVPDRFRATLRRADDGTLQADLAERRGE
ncbi:MAG: MiaB/RimO family radical SAM methylthiotransferase [Gemmatimonadota bacterium]|nr:MAG: MiaB/RimO family radical SAM methylthiotransferase [Gemmatimonadota bacterium]